MAPFNIVSQMLRRSQLKPREALDVFEPRPGDDASPEMQGAGGGRRRWRQSDVKRAIAAAEQAELQSYRVEIAPDGTIAIVVGAPADTAPVGNPYGDLLDI